MSGLSNQSMASMDLLVQEYVPMRPRDRTICIVIADIALLQCVLVFAGSISILACLWNPDMATLDYDKLVRIMYLFDSNACGYILKVSKHYPILKFNNDTRGYNIHPIKWQKAVSTVSTRLTAKTRRYIEVSITVHFLWALSAVALRIFSKNSEDVRALKFILAVYFYSSIFMIMFDISMALVYISHIKQSLTKGMILRYSGWSTTLKLKSYENFAGWLPIAASICWMRGIIILMINIYCCKTINVIRKKIRRREIRMKYENERFTAIPEPNTIYYSRNNVIVFRSGVYSPER